MESKNKPMAMTGRAEPATCSSSISGAVTQTSNRFVQPIEISHVCDKHVRRQDFPFKSTNNRYSNGGHGAVVARNHVHRKTRAPENYVCFASTTTPSTSSKHVSTDMRPSGSHRTSDYKNRKATIKGNDTDMPSCSNYAIVKGNTAARAKLFSHMSESTPRDSTNDKICGNIGKPRTRKMETDPVPKSRSGNKLNVKSFAVEDSKHGDLVVETSDPSKRSRRERKVLADAVYQALLKCLNRVSRYEQSNKYSKDTLVEGTNIVYNKTRRSIPQIVKDDYQVLQVDSIEHADDGKASSRDDARASKGTSASRSPNESETETANNTFTKKMHNVKFNKNLDGCSPQDAHDLNLPSTSKGYSIGGIDGVVAARRFVSDGVMAATSGVQTFQPDVGTVLALLDKQIKHQLTNRATSSLSSLNTGHKGVAVGHGTVSGGKYTTDEEDVKTVYESLLKDWRQKGTRLRVARDECNFYKLKTVEYDNQIHIQNNHFDLLNHHKGTLGKQVGHIMIELEKRKKDIDLETAKSTQLRGSIENLYKSLEKLNVENDTTTVMLEHCLTSLNKVKDENRSWLDQLTQAANKQSDEIDLGAQQWKN